MKWKRKLPIAGKGQHAADNGVWKAARPWLLRLSPLLALGGSICVTSAVLHQPIWIGLVVGIVLGAAVLAMAREHLATYFGETGLCRLPAGKKLEQCRFYSPTTWEGGCVWREGHRCMCSRH